MWTTECEDGVIRPWYCVHDKGCSAKLGLGVSICTCGGQWATWLPLKNGGLLIPDGDPFFEPGTEKKRKGWVGEKDQHRIGDIK